MKISSLIGLPVTYKQPCFLYFTLLVLFNLFSWQIFHSLAGGLYCKQQQEKTSFKRSWSNHSILKNYCIYLYLYLQEILFKNLHISKVKDFNLD